MINNNDGSNFELTPEFTHHIMPLLAHVLVPAAMLDEADITGVSSITYVSSLEKLMLSSDDIPSFIRMYTQFAECISSDSEVSNVLDGFTPIVRRIWHRKREDLEVLSPAMAPHRDEIIAVWTELGRTCGVDVDAPYDPSLEIQDAAERTSKKMCAWRECLCFGEQPQHPLRACKKCMKVRYCSSKCQRRYAPLLSEPKLLVAVHS